MASWDISHKTTSDVPNQPPKDISKRPFLTHAVHPIIPPHQRPYNYFYSQKIHLHPILKTKILINSKKI